jgi:Ca-activated chloride channel family protein
MTFAVPQWLWAFALFPVLLALAVASERRRAELIAKLVAARLAPKLAGTVSLAKRRVRLLLALLGLAGAILALARPQWGFTFEEAKRKGRDVIFAIDTSRSMLADDVKPSRLERAKLAAQDLIAELGGDRVGVIAFAGTSFLQAPLTVDYTAVLGAVKELDTEVIPQGGSNLEGALRSAREAFGKGESENRALVIFSDGEELDADAHKALEEFKGKVRVFSVGIGTPEGALIPVRTKAGLQFVKDETGQPVRTKLDESRLRNIAEATGGFYVHLETGRAEMQRIARDGLGKMKENDIDARLSRRPIERFQWPLAGALVALSLSMFIGERRRAGMARVAAMLVVLLPFSAQAKNEGVEAYHREQYEQAQNEFQRQLKRRPNLPALEFDLGAAAYKRGDYSAALDAFGRAMTSEDPALRTQAAYNLGNTLVQRGAKQDDKKAKLAEWHDAVKKYDESLKLNPKHADAAYNRDIVQRMIAELEQEEKKQDDQQKKDQDQKKDDDKEQKKDDQNQQPNKDDQQKDQQKKDQQQQDQKSQDGQQQKPEKGDQQKEQQPQQGQDSKDQQDAKPGEQKDGKEGKEGEKKDEGQQSKDQKGEQGQQQQQQKDGKEGQKPEPMPQPDGPKKEGELKGAEPQPGESQEQKDAAEAQAEAQAVAEGRMTPEQARALLESLKGQDEKVRLADPRERGGLKRVLKDW